MKTNPCTAKKTEAADRDTIIGRALSHALANCAPVEQCPTAEQLAAFIDGSVTEERDRLLGHLAACDRCREIYLLAQDLNKPEAARQGRRGWYLAGGAVAAAALVILTVKLTIQQPVSPGQQVVQAPAALPHQVALAPPPAPKPSAPAVHGSKPHPASLITPFATDHAARQLAQAASADALAAAIGAPKSGSYGFAGSGNSQASAFRVGQELFELELWLAAGDRERAGLAAERLAPLLGSVAGDAAKAPLDNLLRQLENDVANEKLENSASRIETLLKSGDQGLIRLGSWAAGARVAAATGADWYFSSYPTARLLREITVSLPPGAADDLQRIERASSAGQRDNQALSRALGDLAGRF